MMTILLTMALTALLLSLFSTSYFTLMNRYSAASSKAVSSIYNILPANDNTKSIFSTTMLTMIMINMMGNVPGMKAATMFYWSTVSVSMTLWIALMLTIYHTQLSAWVSHLLPFGSPMGLAPLLPLIEAFSHIIRPFTLMIRLSTNLSSGHIMLYMFSFFSLSSIPLTALLSVVLVVLMLLEIFVSLLQAYIFSSLMSMYITETQ